MSPTRQGGHRSHGWSLSTRADSLLSRAVSQPATHSSWVVEWGWGRVGESVDPPDTGCIMLGQCCNTAGSGTRRRLTLRVTCVCSRYPRGKTHTLALFHLVIGDGRSHVLLADTPIAYNRCVIAQRCYRVPPSLWGKRGVHQVSVTCRKSGLAHMQISRLPALTYRGDLAFIYSHISSSRFWFAAWWEGHTKLAGLINPQCTPPLYTPHRHTHTPESLLTC